MEEIGIQFSRHAKRRMALYEIPEPTARALVESQKKAGFVSKGEKLLIPKI